MNKPSFSLPLVSAIPPAGEGRSEDTWLERIRTLFLGWPEVTVKEDDCHPFPLRDMVPGVTTHLEAMRRYSVRDMRYLCRILGITDDFRDGTAFYERYLDIVEIVPWLACWLDYLVAEERTGPITSERRTRASTRQRRFQILSKLPCDKLRLENNPHLQGELDTLFEGGAIEADLAVGLFYEFALLHFRELLRNRSREEFLDHVRTALHEAIQAANPDQDMDGLLEPDAEAMSFDLNEETTVEPSMMEMDTEADEEPLADLVAALKALAASIDTVSRPEDFLHLAVLSERCAALATGPETIGIPDLEARLQALGLTSATGLSADTQMDLARLLTSAEDAQCLVGQLEIEVQEMDAAIDEASAGRRYGELGPLGAQAEALAARLSEARDRLAADIAALSALLEGGDSTAERTTAPGSRPIIGEAETIPQPEVAKDRSVTAVSEELSGTSLISGTSDASRAPDSADDKEPAEHHDQSEAADAPEKDMSSPAKMDEPEGPADEDPTPPELTERSTDPAGEFVEGCKTTLAPSVTDEEEPGTTLLPTAADALLPALLDADLPGLAADMAAALEANGHRWEIGAAVLRAAAASRAPQRDYGPDTARFTAIAERARPLALRDHESVLLFGALLRPAILERTQVFRPRMTGLARGPLGQYLIETAEAIAGLTFEFPPSPDELARLSGTARVPQRKRIGEKLAAWCSVTSQKTSRWDFATSFMRFVVSDEGPIGRACHAMASNEAGAIDLVRDAIAQLQEPSAIEAAADAYAARERYKARLHARGVDYLHRQFAEAFGLLDDWVRAGEAQNTARSEDRLRATLFSLRTRIGKAQRQLEIDAELSQVNDDELRASVARWIARRCGEAMTALAGGDGESCATLDEAILGERDLLPASLRSLVDNPAALHDPLLAFLETGLPTAVAALDRARAEGAFETAFRLVRHHDMIETAALAQESRAFASRWMAEIEARDRRLKILGKVDLAHQDEIARWRGWCQSTLARLAPIAEGQEIDDLCDIPAEIGDLDTILDRIASSIRADQVARIGGLRTEKNAEEADAVLKVLHTLAPQAVEDRIAQLRDGRSAAVFRSDAGLLISRFTPGFVEAANQPGWPRTSIEYRRALAAPGPLQVEEDRRTAAYELIDTYLALSASVVEPKPLIGNLRFLLEDLGFEKVQFSQTTRIGRGRGFRMHMTARRVTIDGLFVPPVFGSRAGAGFQVLLVAPDMLPETVKAAIDPKLPTILVIAGIIDLAKRHEYAERLRSAALPVLLIDEALVAFAATRRETRAETIFECGLPYGRVEPYTTDAGQIPAEMFFGREAEIRSIMSRTSEGCLVYGGRQLGKSVLLSHVARRFHDPAADIIVVRREVKSLGDAEPTSAIWSHIRSMLADHGVVQARSLDWQDIERDIRAWFSTRPHGQIVCMFDETDHFMAAETLARHKEMSKLKQLMEDTQRAFKVVFAGLHNVQRMWRQSNSTLPHFNDAICIGPLNRTQDDKRAAHALIVAPMQAAGFRFESDDDVDEILSWANYYPSLIQEYAKGLLATLHGAGSGKAYRLTGNGPLWTIPSRQLFHHQGFQQIESRVRDKFHLTLDLDPRYALVAYTLAWLNAEGNEQKALVSGYRPAELRDQVLEFWPRTGEIPSPATFETLLEEMFDLGVLGRIPIEGTRGYSYCLRTREVAAMLGSKEDVMQTLLEFEEKDPEVTYDPSIHRRTYATPGTDHSEDRLYIPLTDLQIERLMADTDRAPRIVCGLDLLGLGKVVPTLRRLAEQSGLPGVARGTLPVLQSQSRKELRAATDAVRSPSMTVLLHTPASAGEAEEALDWLDRKPSVLDGHLRPIILLNAADAAMRMLATRRADQAEWLTAWGSEMLRVHLRNVERTNLDTSTRRAAILAAAGGVPQETIRLVQAAGLADDPDEVLATFRANLPDPERIASRQMLDALALIEDQHTPGDYEALDDLLRTGLGTDLVTLGPDLLALGLIAGWNPARQRIRRSALGDLVVQRRA
ncbi:hypothetical protein U5903_09430 [Cereibacter johrii]|uniref:hypothetical protein n=1 Tax=Cereibacter johrii TaxID=445629 RepID=UPI002B25D8E9|nr:hypothetical protein [Cereibacter johrii]MEA5160990.1 hypothetical protein [Cereibacter johrii]